jgi:hypothetical protein
MPLGSGRLFGTQLGNAILLGSLHFGRMGGVVGTTDAADEVGPASRWCPDPPHPAESRMHARIAATRAAGR